jgi:hypothetical protein
VKVVEMRKYLLLIIIFSFAFTEKFQFVVIGDRTENTVGHIFEEILDEVSVLHPDFVINTGNIIHGYSGDTTVLHAQWDTVLSMVDRLPCKFYFVPGANDIQDDVACTINGMVHGRLHLDVKTMRGHSR